VHGRIQRRQQQRWAAQDQAADMAPPPPAPAAPPPQPDMGERIAQLKQLGELKSAGILTDAEFEQQRPASSTDDLWGARTAPTASELQFFWMRQ
jgi:hypothetical protein